MKITKRAVDAATKAGKDTYLWDDDIKGFGLKVTPLGRKVYIVQYRVGGRGSKTRRITMGTHGSLTAEQARKLAQKYLGQVASGIDPLAEKDAAKSDLSVQEAFEEFNAKHISVKLKPRTAHDYRRIFEVYVLPRFKNIGVKNISKQHILRLHDDLHKTPYRANCVVRVLSKFFNWCEQYEYRAEHTNPARHIQKYKETPANDFCHRKSKNDFGPNVWLLSRVLVCPRYTGTD